MVKSGRLQHHPLNSSTDGRCKKDERQSEREEAGRIKTLHQAGLAKLLEIGQDGKLRGDNGAIANRPATRQTAYVGGGGNLHTIPSTLGI